MALQRQPSPVSHRCGRFVILVWMVFLTLGARFLAQQAQPDLTGEWKLNTERSKSTTWAGHELPDVIEIKQSGLKVKMRRPNSTLHGETYSYVIDGKERLAYFSAAGVAVQAKAYWDGDSLVIERRETGHSVEWFWTSRYSLSTDGKVLSVNNRRPRDPKPSFYSELIYEKQ